MAEAGNARTFTERAARAQAEGRGVRAAGIQLRHHAVQCDAQLPDLIRERVHGVRHPFVGGTRAVQFRLRLGGFQSGRSLGGGA